MQTATSNCAASPAQSITDDGLSLGASGFQVQLDIRPFVCQEVHVCIQSNAVLITGSHHESGDNACKTHTLSKTYFLPRPVNEQALFAQFSPYNVLTLAAPWV